MADTWHDNAPIYMQLRDKVAGLIMAGQFAEGEAIPSVRQVSADYKINHLTVAKAYQELVDSGVLEMRRGRGMFVLSGARNKLMQQARTEFEQTELPQLLLRAKQLGIDENELIEKIHMLISKVDPAEAEDGKRD